MNVEDLTDIIGADFYVGVPDSQLKALCDYLMDRYGIDKKHHIIAANEGNCVAIAAGYQMATGKIPVVYMQNSGEGNAVNPVVSLINEKVYAIPMVFIIGWRGEPGIHDEPQHIFQGQVTLELLDALDIQSFVLDTGTTREEIQIKMMQFNKLLSAGKSVAFVIRKNSIYYKNSVVYSNSNGLIRENVIEKIVRFSKNDPIISTTGKISRELYEVRERNGLGHNKDFLTVGSMGHASSIALGVAINTPDKRIWCIDGDGAAIMHMGALTVIGAIAPDNYVHILINNEAHESVGGLPTVGNVINFADIAKASGYKRIFVVRDDDELENALKYVVDSKQLVFIEVKCSIKSRANLGRPTTSAIENKNAFVCELQKNIREKDGR